MQGRDICTTRASHEKHSLAWSTHPAIALKSCSASRIYSAQDFSTQRDPAKLSIGCKIQEGTIFGRDRGDLSVAAPYPALLQGCCTWDCPSPCSFLWRDPRGAAPMGHPSIAWGSPCLPLAGVSTQITPLSRAGSREARVSSDITTASPIFRDQMG